MTVLDDILSKMEKKSFRLDEHHLKLLIRNLNSYYSTGIVHSLPHSETEIISDNSAQIINNMWYFR